MRCQHRTTAPALPAEAAANACPDTDCAAIASRHAANATPSTIPFDAIAPVWVRQDSPAPLDRILSDIVSGTTVSSVLAGSANWQSRVPVPVCQTPTKWRGPLQLAQQTPQQRICMHVLSDTCHHSWLVQDCSLQSGRVVCMMVQLPKNGGICGGGIQCKSPPAQSRRVPFRPH